MGNRGVKEYKSLFSYGWSVHFSDHCLCLMITNCPVSPSAILQCVFIPCAHMCMGAEMPSAEVSAGL